MFLFNLESRGPTSLMKVLRSRFKTFTVPLLATTLLVDTLASTPTPLAPATLLLDTLQDMELVQIPIQQAATTRLLVMNQWVHHPLHPT